MGWVTFIWLALTLVPPASGPALPESARDQALARLRAQLCDVELVPGRTLASVDAPIDELLGDAQQIGGPRWVDAETCQVRLELPSEVLRQRLIHVATTRPVGGWHDREIAERTREWPRRRYAAEGIASTARLPATRPTSRASDADPEWATTLLRGTGTAADAGDRLRTARAAERVARDALRRKAISLANVNVTDRAIAAAIADTLPRAAVSRITYRADGSAEVEVVLDGRLLSAAIRDVTR